MTQLYRCEMKVWATAYIKADSMEEAIFAAGQLENEGLHLPTGMHGVEISDKQFGDADLPDISLSPAMTIGSVDTTDLEEFE